MMLHDSNFFHLVTRVDSNQLKRLKKFPSTFWHHWQLHPWKDLMMQDPSWCLIHWYLRISLEWDHCCAEGEPKFIGSNKNSKQRLDITFSSFVFSRVPSKPNRQVQILSLKHWELLFPLLPWFSAWSPAGNPMLIDLLTWRSYICKVIKGDVSSC